MIGTFMPAENWDEEIELLGGAGPTGREPERPDFAMPDDLDPEAAAELEHIAHLEQEAYDRWYYTAMGAERARAEMIRYRLDSPVLRLPEDMKWYVSRDEKPERPRVAAPVRASSPPGPRVIAPPVTYFIREGTDGPIKIGKSNNPEKRMRGFQTHHAKRLQLLATTKAYEEGELHRRFAHLRLAGEWFRAEPELLDFIATLPSPALLGNPG